jgi:hypothetical protein
MLKYQIMKIRLVVAELLHAEKTEGRTDKRKLIVVFRNFANMPKKKLNP